MTARIRLRSSPPGRAATKAAPALEAAAGLLAASLLAAALLAAVLLAAGGCARRPPVATAPADVTLSTLEPEPAARAGRVAHRLTHVVAPGETLAKIAETYYGDPARHRDLARDNQLGETGRLAAGANLEVRFSEDEWRRYQQRAAALAPYNRGVDLLAAGQLEEAESALRSALDLAPDLAAARYNLALVWMKRGRYELAEQALAELLARRPRDRDFLYAHGNALFHQARFAEAAAAFRRLLEAAPGHRAGAFGLARALQEGGRKAEAIAAWEAYLRLDATSDWATEARRSLARLRGD